MMMLMMMITMVMLMMLIMCGEETCAWPHVGHIHVGDSSIVIEEDIDQREWCLENGRIGLDG